MFFLCVGYSDSGYASTRQLRMLFGSRIFSIDGPGQLLQNLSSLLIMKSHEFIHYEYMM